MRIVVPAVPAVLSTNVAATALGEWSPATTYASGATVSYTAVQPLPHHEFESLQANNQNHRPAIGGTDWWLDLGACNRHKMFDDRVNSRTVATAADGSLRITMSAAAGATVVALLNLRNAAAVTITQTVGGLLKSTVTVNPLNARSYVYDLPSVGSNPVIAVDLLASAPATPVECGHCVLGAPTELGATEWGAQPGLLDYSTFEKTTYGDTIFVARQNVRENSFTTWVETADFDRVFNYVESVLGTLVLIDANNADTSFDALRVFGKIASFRPGLRYNRTPIDVRVEGIA